MNDEKDFRKWVIARAKEYGCHVAHIEAHESAAGIPDLNIFPQSRPRRRPRRAPARPDLWLELKVIKDGQIKLRPTQRRWHRERHEAGGRSWVAVLDRATNDILVLPGHIAAGLDSRAGSWRSVAVVSNVLLMGRWLADLVVENERNQSKPNRNRAAQDPGSAEAPLSASGQNVGGDHWLLSDARTGGPVHGGSENSA